LHEAKVANRPAVTVWGTGSPKREFLFADDLVDACVFLMANYDDPVLVNIGTGEDLRIKELAQLIQSIVGLAGGVVFDSSQPDGRPRILMDASKRPALGRHHATPLEAGIRTVYGALLANCADR